MFAAKDNDMNATKNFILEKSFGLFLQKGYNGVSIRNIQEETRLSKGAIYHHFQGKEEIFAKAMDLFFFPALRSFHYSDDETNTPLKNALNEAIEHRKGHIDKLREMTDFKVDDFYFFKLAFQVEEFYPDFKSKVENTFSEEENEWREVLQMAVQKGEIRKNTNIDLTLSLLMLIPRGLGLSMAFSSGISTDSLKEIYQKFYRTLKE